ncbi:MAG: hypothetical protein HON53_15695 [Planctomycetaceae bacterium]|nr:hypothetical protein [Planctomycetaceae bacterium]
MSEAALAKQASRHPVAASVREAESSAGESARLAFQPCPLDESTEYLATQAAR